MIGAVYLVLAAGLQSNAGQAVGAAGTVGGSMLAGASIAETTGAVIGAVVGVVTLAITVVGLNERRRRQYRREIRAARRGGWRLRDPELAAWVQWGTYIRQLAAAGVLTSTYVLPPTPPASRPPWGDGDEDEEADDDGT